MDPSHDNPDPVHKFLLEAQRITRDAEFIIDSLPNVDLPAVERAIHQLYAVSQILIQIEDPYLAATTLDKLLDIVVTMSVRLEEFAKDDPTPPSLNLPKVHSGTQGRPKYDLDIEELLHIHRTGSSWADIARLLKISRATIYNHLRQNGITITRPAYTEINDDDLDELISQISLEHPFAGSVIMSGHLETQGVHVSRARIQESLRRVDAIGVLVRWAGIIKRRVYHVRGANALWHHDGNEKLRPWGFYIHGCVDGYSRLLIYLRCCNNKRAATVEALFLDAVRRYGWPSRIRGDYGTENNSVERQMIEHWGQRHNAYLRGRSLQNIRMEQAWRDVRKDTIELFRQIFQYLEENGLLDLNDPIHCLALYIVFQPRIQASLNRTLDAWNLHKIRTAHYRSPVALFTLSRAEGIRDGYWSYDPGDGPEVANDPLYGWDGEAHIPPADEQENRQANEEGDDALAEDRDIEVARESLGEFDVMQDDGNWGIDLYCEVVISLGANGA